MMKLHQIRKGRAFPLQNVLVISFILQIVGAVSLVSYLSFKNGQKAVNNLAEQLIERTGDLVNEHLTSYLSVPQTLNQTNAAAMRRGMPNINERDVFGKYFRDQMQIYDLTFVGISLVNGEGIGAVRYGEKTVTIDERNAKVPNSTQTYATNPYATNPYATNHRRDRASVIGTYPYNHLTASWYTSPLKAGKPTWTQVYSRNSPYGPYLTASVT